jgi:hypothetical protein
MLMQLSHYSREACARLIGKPPENCVRSTTTETVPLGSWEIKPLAKQRSPAACPALRTVRVGGPVARPSRNAGCSRMPGSRSKQQAGTVCYYLAWVGEISAQAGLRFMNGPQILKHGSFLDPVAITRRQSVHATKNPRHGLRTTKNERKKKMTRKVKSETCLASRTRSQAHPTARAATERDSRPFRARASRARAAAAPHQQGGERVEEEESARWAQDLSSRCWSATSTCSLGTASSPSLVLYLRRHLPAIGRFVGDSALFLGDSR